MYRAIEGIDRSQLEEFQAGMRKRYSDEHILEELNACAKRLGRSPTMREFEADPETTVHPQTVIEHFKSWNRAKRLAGLVPRRFATREELLRLLRDLGEQLGRVPTAKDIEARKGSMPSKSLYWHTFGSLNNALKEAGFDVPVGEERLERAIDQGSALALRVGRLPKFADWAQARRADDVDADRVAGLPDVRRPPRSLVDVPVPDPQAARGHGRGRLARGPDRLTPAVSADRAVLALQQLKLEHRLERGPRQQRWNRR